MAGNLHNICNEGNFRNKKENRKFWKYFIYFNSTSRNMELFVYCHYKKSNPLMMQSLQSSFKNFRIKFSKIAFLF